ncbi:hypothetical protein BKA64DRAFT_225717 [Cadophora sp. MPI-SDFR-AT-0126]|nr:hypothetical protein BKA64DRAFT_225717 [Leotiomycetes sp. MPI-SDFR-AT-0126]
MLTKGGGPITPNRMVIEDEYMRPYIVWLTQTHEEAGASDVGYPEQWQQIRDTIATFVPAMADPSRWKDISFVAVVDVDQYLLDKVISGRGKNVFKYDPAHHISCYEPQAMAALWVEEEKTPHHSDKW